MKKILVLALAVVMMMAMSVTAFAAELQPDYGWIEGEDGEWVQVDDSGRNNGSLEGGFDSLTIPVYGVDNNQVDEAVYDIVISWDNMEFTYTTKWDSDALKNVGRFEYDEAGVSVESRSNRPVNVAVSTSTETNFIGTFEVALNDGGMGYINGVIYEELTDSSVQIEAATDEQAYRADYRVWVSEGSTLSLGEGETRAQIGSVTVTVSTVGESEPDPEEPAPDEPVEVEVNTITVDSTELSSFTESAATLNQPNELVVTEDGNVWSVMNASCDSEYFEWSQMEGTFKFTDAGEFEVSFQFDNMERHTITFYVEEVLG